MPAIVEGWIDKVLAPPWAFRFKKLFGNYGYPVVKLKGKKSVRYPINPTNIAVPAKVNETGYPARRKIANKTKRRIEKNSWLRISVIFFKKI